MVEKSNLSEIYNNAFISTILPIFDITSLLTIVLTIILISVIVTKTPKHMKSFKPYLLSNSFIYLLLIICFALYSPMIIHPYACFYPLGYIKILPPLWSPTLLYFTFYIALAVVDSCAAMALERFFAIRNLSSSKIPARIYAFLLFTDLLAFTMCLMFIVNPSLRNVLILFEEESLNFMNQNFYDFGVIDFRYLVILSGTSRNNIPYTFIIFLINATLHLSIVSTILLLNLYSSKKLESNISVRLQKYNTMILRMTYIQFFGMFSVLGLTFLTWIILFLAIPEPSKIPTFFVIIMYSYCFFDIFITAFFIKPYRKFFISFFKKPSLVIPLKYS